MFDCIDGVSLIQSTFLHFKGIGRITEKKLWGKGIKNWDQLEYYDSGGQMSLFENTPKIPIIREIEESRQALFKKDIDFFAKRLYSTTIPENAVIIWKNRVESQSRS
jgi:hypothetical protein